MKKWLALVVVILLALATYVGAGPYLTVRAIRSAVKSQDASALAKQVDFPALRSSLKAQLTDRLVRDAGADMQANIFGAFGLSLASGLVGGAVEVMATPSGLGAMMQGRAIWNHLDDGLSRGGSAGPAPEPFQDAIYRYESLSRFTATVDAGHGAPLVFVFSRYGLQWRLSDIQLPR